MARQSIKIPVYTGNYNSITIKSTIYDLFIEKITCTEEDGSERILASVNKIIPKDFSIIFKESRSSIVTIYYDHIITPTSITDFIKVYASNNRYVKSGSFKTKEVVLGYKKKFIINVEYDNIGDAHISACCSFGLLDENMQKIFGKDIKIPISSNTVYIDSDDIDGYDGVYGYIDNSKITDISLLKDKMEDVYRFGIPLSMEKAINYDGVSVNINQQASYVSVAVEVFIINTDVSKGHHTPLVKNISIVGY